MIERVKQYVIDHLDQFDCQSLASGILRYNGGKDLYVFTELLDAIGVRQGDRPDSDEDSAYLLGWLMATNFEGGPVEPDDIYQIMYSLLEHDWKYFDKRGNEIIIVDPESLIYELLEI